VSDVSGDLDVCAAGQVVDVGGEIVLPVDVGGVVDETNVLAAYRELLHGAVDVRMSARVLTELGGLLGRLDLRG
jgi:hypothetical protein